MERLSEVTVLTASAQTDQTARLVTLDVCRQLIIDLVVGDVNALVAGTGGVWGGRETLTALYTLYTPFIAAYAPIYTVLYMYIHHTYT